MKDFLDGNRKFRETEFQNLKGLFERLSGGQGPGALFIACIDSRIDPNLITQSRPGDMFALRTVGNIVPPYDPEGGENSVGAALEMALVKFGVQEIIVCGHSDCGAMKALYQEEGELDEYPHVLRWLCAAHGVREKVSATSDTRQRDAEEANVSLQLDNLLTYPLVAGAVKDGKLSLYGWHFDVATCQISMVREVSGEQ